LINVALVIIFGWLLATTVVGIMAGRNRAFSMEEYFVAGRSFGLILFYTTAAAEIYSSFAFLGLAGWAYSKGMSITYALAYGSIAYAIYFLLGPRINRLGKRMNYISQPDYLEDRYGSRGLGVLAAIIGVVFIIPYLQLQIMGSGMIVQLASGGGHKLAVGGSNQLRCGGHLRLRIGPKGYRVDQLHAGHNHAGRHGLRWLPGVQELLRRGW